LSLITDKRNLLESANLLVKTTSPMVAAQALQDTMDALQAVINGMFESEPGTFHLLTLATAKKP